MGRYPFHLSANNDDARLVFKPKYFNFQYSNLSLFRCITRLFALPKANDLIADADVDVSYLIFISLLLFILILFYTIILNSTQKMTALHWACFHRKPNITSFLISRGAPEDIGDVDRKVHIILCVWKWNWTLEIKSSILFMNSFFKKFVCFRHHCTGQHKMAARCVRSCLLTARADLSAISLTRYFHIYSKNISNISFIYGHSFSLFFKDGHTPAHLAAAGGHGNVIKVRTLSFYFNLIHSFIHPITHS